MCFSSTGTEDELDDSLIQPLALENPVLKKMGGERRTCFGVWKQADFLRIRAYPPPPPQQGRGVFNKSAENQKQKDPFCPETSRYFFGLDPEHLRAWEIESHISVGVQILRSRAKRENFFNLPVSSLI